MGKCYISRSKQNEEIWRILEEVYEKGGRREEKKIKLLFRLARNITFSLLNFNTNIFRISLPILNWSLRDSIKALCLRTKPLIFCISCRSRLSLCAKRWAGGEEDQPGWTVSFCWNSGKKKVYDFWKKRQTIQEQYKYVLKSCREKPRKAKT